MLRESHSNFAICFKMLKFLHLIFRVYYDPFFAAAAANADPALRLQVKVNLNYKNDFINYSFVVGRNSIFDENAIGSNTTSISSVYPS